MSLVRTLFHTKFLSRLHLIGFQGVFSTLFVETHFDIYVEILTQNSNIFTECIIWQQREREREMHKCHKCYKNIWKLALFDYDYEIVVGCLCLCLCFYFYLSLCVSEYEKQCNQPDERFSKNNRMLEFYREFQTFFVLWFILEWNTNNKNKLKNKTKRCNTNDGDEAEAEAEEEEEATETFSSVKLLFHGFDDCFFYPSSSIFFISFLENWIE